MGHVLNWLVSTCLLSSQHLVPQGAGKETGTGEAELLGGDGLRLQAGLACQLAQASAPFQGASQLAFVLPWLLLKLPTWLRTVFSDP